MQHSADNVYLKVEIIEIIIVSWTKENTVLKSHHVASFERLNLNTAGWMCQAYLPLLISPGPPEEPNVS